MTRTARAGLLPLYLKLYDETVPEVFPHFESFLQTVVAGLEAAGVEVLRGAVCRVAPEFQAAVAAFEQQEVDIIVTLHLAYSPSLESVEALTQTPLPILMLDTTLDAAFGMATHPDRIMFNHGIHGVQDLASMLRRRGKQYEIVAGPANADALYVRAAGIIRAARAARALRGMRVLRVGETFRGMGDFSVPEALLRESLDIVVEQIGVPELAAAVAEVSSGEIEAEARCDAEHYHLDLAPEVHRRSLRVGLGLRRLLEQGGYGAFSMNFLAFDSSEGPVDVVPFLEASKAMSRGLGYAGEGDVLTAALVGALGGAFDAVTFTEVFCPDWEGGAIFFSHMGEINPAVLEGGARVFEKPFPFTAARNPAVLTGAVRPGPAVLVNLLPGPEGRFELLCAPLEIQRDESGPEMRDVIRLWARPEGALESFLERYSKLGGTHHSALVLGVCPEALEAFGRMAGFDAVTRL